MLTAARCLLRRGFPLRDRRRARSLHGLPADLDHASKSSERSYDEAIVTVLRRESAVRVGIEAAWLPVSRFNALGAPWRPKRHFRCSPSSAFRSSCRPSGWSSASASSRTRARSPRSAKPAGACRRSRGGCHRSCRPASRERDVAFEHRGGDAGRRVQRPAFDTIVASGPNSALPHARPTDRPAGGRGADGAGLRGRLRRILRGSDADGPAWVRPGKMCGGCTTRSRRRTRRPLPPFSRAPGRARSTRRRGKCLKPHGLGRRSATGPATASGLEVHEEPRIARCVRGCPDEPIEPGMVFTIEPGAYVPGVGGVRIEDDVLVTADGCEVLTDVPRRVDIR